MKSERNKTIDLTIEEGREYLERCLRAKELAGILPGCDPAANAEYDSAADAEHDSGILPEHLTDRVILGDTFAVLPVLPKGFVDLLVVDPPYNLSKEYSGTTFRAMPEEDYAEFTRRWLSLCMPLLKETASVYVCCDWRSSMIIGPILQEYLTIRNRITWQREKGRGAQANWKNGMEDIWFATKSKEYTFNVDAVKLRRRVIAPYRENGVPKGWHESDEGRFRDTFPSNFWDDISIPYWSMAENTAHPTQKPEKLLAKLILASSNPGDMVFDPFLGSGSTAVTAQKLNRRYCGIEINPQYCIWARKRLENALTDKSIQGFTDGVFWERNTSAIQKRS